LATHRLVIDGKEYRVEVGTRSGSHVDVSVNGVPHSVEILDGRPARITRSVPAPAAVPASTRRAIPAAGPRGAPGAVLAPISGVVLRIAVSRGDKVSAGSVLLVLEAMKMDNEIFAPIAGIVEDVAVRPEQQVAQGTLLVTLKPA
jgi:glutaconyl-CoA decarboxylase